MFWYNHCIIITMAALSFKSIQDCVALKTPDAGCLPSTHTLPPGAQRALGHNVKFHMAELPGQAIIGPHA